jgi:hypothetical protein
MKKYVKYISIFFFILLSFFIISCSTGKQQIDKIKIPPEDQYVIAVIRNIDSDSLITNNYEIKINNDDNATDSIAVTEKYPNPFSPPSNYGFKVEEPDSFKISFLDRDGNIISNLFDGFLTAGIYEMRFNEMHINSDIYFIVIDSGKKKWTKKLIYAR